MDADVLIQVAGDRVAVKKHRQGCASLFAVLKQTPTAVAILQSALRALKESGHVAPARHGTHPDSLARSDAPSD